MGWASESPARKKRRQKTRKAQEERWAAKAGPLKVYYRDPPRAWNENGRRRARRRAPLRGGSEPMTSPPVRSWLKLVGVTDGHVPDAWTVEEPSLF